MRRKVELIARMRMPHVGEFVMIKKAVPPEQRRDATGLRRYDQELLRGSTPGPAKSQSVYRADRSVAELRDAAARAKMRAYKGLGLLGAARKH
jgi:hypothetical protein